MGKRKLNEHDVPEDAEVVAASTQSAQPSQPSFDNLGLDARLLQGIVRQKFSTPTPVQAKAIPLALEGKDILARSKTGSGKTAAYVLPILHSILKRKADASFTKCTSALILVPTRELAGQVSKTVEAFATFCGQDVRVANLTLREDDAVQRARLADSPDVVVATPGRACVNLNAAALVLDRLAHLVIDEADLVLSYGYDDDLESISKSIPKGTQTFLMSATLSSDLDDLKGLFCRDPVLLELDEEDKDQGKVSQYIVKCAEDEKFLLIYAIFMLKLVKGKVIVFVGDIDRCYRLKLFLEQFGIKSCVLNSELPVNSRIHVVEEFNKNVYDIIIASDEHEVLGDEDKKKKKRKAKEGDEEEEQDEADGEKEDAKEDAADGAEAKTGDDSTEPPRKKRKGRKKDKEYGIARGIDFQNVSLVLNFDLPTSSKSYTHRIGRTARAGKNGMAISFVIPKDKYRKHKPTSIESCKNDEEVLAKISKSQEKRGNALQPYHFDMKKLEGFRYRLADALRAVTRIAVREARARELRQELLKSEKLKRHFEENPQDLLHLRHDGESRTARQQPHLKHVPEYLLPAGGKTEVEREIGFVGFRKDDGRENRIRKARVQNRFKGKGRIAKTKKADPLKTFNAKGRGKK
ncbi:putative atp dependent rna helicase protein [Lasiodiplodia theobromae]|uniref:ATP dependent RNA helicase n=1 Tax=Lasiodiplodia theobromae TaxID=45133 RepID=UPI0015C34532|nr:ATP dependent RNA helicase [Lasiodiplodia theobromae]KAF4542652.1 ATP dependent RNA helicase [Lasiodiplodia theobromae]KAF9640772.1 putative atp dependent rna helicase protein [Lasiodiplodia theobromae]